MDKFILLVVNLIALQTTKMCSCSLIKSVPISPWLDWSDSSVPETLPDPPYNHSSVPVGQHPVQQVSVYTRFGKVNLGEYVLAYGLKSTGDLPEEMIHGVTIVHGYAFEFIFDKGIFITPAAQFVKETDPIFYDDTFGTNKTAKEIKEWLRTVSEQFKLGSYRLIDNNCFTFIHGFVEFLGGKEPNKYKTLRIWLEQNHEIGSHLQKALDTKTAPTLPTPTKAPH